MQPIIRSVWFKLFVAVAALHLIAGLAKLSAIEFATKPLLLLNLIGLYWSVSKRHHLPTQKNVFAALVFSWLGDVLLMFQNNQPIFFILGLVSFLLAHIAYIIYFLQIIKSRKVFKWNFPAVVAVAAYAVAMFTTLQPKLGAMQIPVMAYTVVISTMLIVALHTVKKKSAASLLCVLGALFFVVSDSILAFNKFHTPFPFAGFAIMLTYCLAQLALVCGILKNGLETKAKR